ncbi:hypothetical protein GCM10025867_41800 [Frondihabitans sucicola]|uniref:Uncharacterized protein n=1 Tax=Frondihabitans sucicola TaxID=1268041 RepID=A0ABM8GU96_9MICO|nr:hypothetical protein [Frondihabitans sucicola]BDZ51939.1 hypothetical protein GCM10025867_41800 [Frondihabitans sucicola]
MTEDRHDDGAGSGEHVPAPAPSGVSRRALFGGGLAAAAGVGALAGIGGSLAAQAASAPPPGEDIDLSASHPFYAEATKQPQGGIRTVPQRYCVLMTFDMSSTLTADLQVLLARWSAAIAQLQAGKTIGSVSPRTARGSAPTPARRSTSAPPR